MTRAQRALVAAFAIVPTTVAGLALIRCGCGEAAWVIELFAAVAFGSWLLSSKR